MQQMTFKYNAMIENRNISMLGKIDIQDTYLKLLYRSFDTDNLKYWPEWSLQVFFHSYPHVLS